jgi:hypothetical protein
VHVPGKEELVESIRLFDTITAPRLKSAGVDFGKCRNRELITKLVSVHCGWLPKIYGEIRRPGRKRLLVDFFTRECICRIWWTINSYNTRGACCPSKRTGFSVRCIKISLIK